MNSRFLTRRAALRTVFAGGLLSRYAHAASSARTLVGIYLSGGADTHNLIVPLGAAHRAYSESRKHLAIPEAALVPARTTSSETRFGFHPAAAPLASLFEQRVLAIVAGVGAETVPTSHRNTRLRYLPGGYLAPAFAPEGAVRTLHGGVSVTSIDGAAPALETAPSVELRTVFPETSLGTQLRGVASLLASGAAPGRQVICCTLDGFDTHGRMLERQTALFAELSQALAAFHAATVELGISQQVTTFTDSEFNRALAPNGRGGTEHGWAGFQLVLGGSAAGGELHGALEFASDVTGSGVFAPTTTRSAFEATLARWAGFDSPSANPLGGALPRFLL